MYGKNDPVNNIDPSGEVTLNDTLATVGIIGSLSAIGWNAGNFNQLQNFYEFVADTYAPDAGIIGVSVFGKLNIDTLIIDLVMPKELDMAIDSMSSHIVKPYWHDPSPHQNSLGFVGGGELMLSFGSSQMGGFVYGGLQKEIQKAKIKKRGAVDISLYTGYVFNLWNTWDYRGPFMAVNFPGGSFFFDPFRLLKNEEHPWGVSWPFWSNSKSTTLGGINGTGFVRIGIGDPLKVSYGKLAFDWTLLQAAIMTVLVYKHHETAAIVTGFGAAATGFFVKSKQIYNKRNDFVEGQGENAHYERLYIKKRPNGWRSGPTNPLRLLLGLWS